MSNFKELIRSAQQQHAQQEFESKREKEREKRIYEAKQLSLQTDHMKKLEVAKETARKAIEDLAVLLNLYEPIDLLEIIREAAWKKGKIYSYNNFNKWKRLDLPYLFTAVGLVHSFPTAIEVSHTGWEGPNTMSSFSFDMRDPGVNCFAWVIGVENVHNPVVYFSQNSVTISRNEFESGYFRELYESSSIDFHAPACTASIEDLKKALAEQCAQANWNKRLTAMENVARARIRKSKDIPFYNKFGI